MPATNVLGIPHTFVRFGLSMLKAHGRKKSLLLMPLATAEKMPA